MDFLLVEKLETPVLAKMSQVNEIGVFLDE
jgi:hypothetical protein